MTDVHIRELNINDSEKFLALLRAIDAESVFLIFEENERDNNLEKCQKYLKKFLNPSKGLILVVVDKYGKLVGHITGERFGMNKKKHVMRVSIGLLKKYYGAGRKLVIDFLKKTDQLGIDRIEAEVIEDNVLCLNLAKKMGFNIDGFKQNAICINGKFLGEYMISRVRSGDGN